jgi:hypothetical protein
MDSRLNISQSLMYFILFIRVFRRLGVYVYMFIFVHVDHMVHFIDFCFPDHQIFWT